MNANEIVNALKGKSGRHVPAVWEKKMKTLKGVTLPITKKTTAYVRAGIDYANLSTVKEGVESGERGDVQGLPWGEWELFPFIIRHTPKGASVSFQYVRLYPAVFDNLKTTVQYFIDGHPAKLEQVKPLCLASEFRDEEKEITCFTLRAENILSIG